MVEKSTVSGIDGSAAIPITVRFREGRDSRAGSKCKLRAGARIAFRLRMRRSLA